MTDSGPRETKQEIDWLTPDQVSGEVRLPWPDEGGPFELTVHVARVDGRAIVVGLDIRSFRYVPPSGDRLPVNRETGLVEVNHPALRSLRPGEIAEAARREIAVRAAMFLHGNSIEYGTPEQDAQARRDYERRLAAVSEPGAARPPVRTGDTERLQMVASLYREALAAGGDAARRPARYVEEQLRATGQEVTSTQVRGQIYRARKAGLLGDGPD